MKPGKLLLKILAALLALIYVLPAMVSCDYPKTSPDTENGVQQSSTTNNGTTNNSTIDNSTIDNSPTDNGTTDNGTTDNGTTDNSTPDNGPPDHEDKQDPDNQDKTNKIYVTEKISSSDDWTSTIQDAIDQMFLLGGGEVIIPAGDYEIVSIRLRSNVTLHLLENAHLIASRDPEAYACIENDVIEPISQEEFTEDLWEPVSIRKDFDFQMKPMSRWNHAVIKALDAENIAIIGEPGSWIDGNNCYDELGEEYYRGPHAINMHRCKNIVLRGYEIRNSSNWAHALFVCENLHVEEVTVFGGHDGIHVTTCTNILIQNCDFQTGDDCIGGFDNLNVEVLGCKINTSCNGIRFGGTNVTIHDSLFYGPSKYRFRGGLSLAEKISGASSENKGGGGTMLSAFTYYADFSREIRDTPGNIVIYNCEFRQATRFLHYNFSGNEAWQRNQPLADITFRNIKADGIRMPLTFWGDPSLRGNLTLENVQISFVEGYSQAFLHLGNFDQVILKDVRIENLHGYSLIRKWTDDGIIQMENCTYPGFYGVEEELTDDPFISTPI